MKQEFDYIKNLPDGSKEEAKLIIESRIIAFSDDNEVNNPTSDDSAYFYGMSIDNGREQIQTFQPGEDGYQPMTKEEAEKFLEDDINQALLNYGIK